VVSAREGDDKFARVLVETEDRDVVADEFRRREHGDEMVEEVRLGLKEIGHRGLHDGLKVMGMSTRDSIPGLGGTSVEVVDAGEKVVLDVPAETTEEHADVQHGDCDS